MGSINSDYSIIEQILTRRGFKREDIDHYLNTTDDDILAPRLIANIDDAVKMIVRHLHGDKRILVVVDSDCDGYTSSAVLLNYLHTHFPTIVEKKIYYEFHDGKIHGIDPNMIHDEVGLVIAPDSSSNDYEVHKALHNKGIEVLVIDHHQADKISPFACVVNNQLCDYPTKSLSGVGMVYKVCKRFDELCGFDNADDFLDLVAVGIVADMMDIHDFETRRLISKGFDALKNPLIRGLYQNSAKRSRNYSPLTPIGVSFQIAPYINSITRVGTMEEKRTLFESMLAWKAFDSIPSTKRGCKGQYEQRIEQAIRLCTNAKNRQNRARDKNLETIEKIIKEKNLLDRKLLIIKLEEFAVDRNLSGLIANQLIAKYQRPVAILNKIISEENQITWEGSARGYDKCGILNFREFVRESGLSILAEGHPNAFGIGFTDEGLDKFIQYSEETLQGMTLEPCTLVDYIWAANDIRVKDVTDIGNLDAFWGQEIPEPYVAIEGINITKDKVTLLESGPTLKIALPNGITCLKFKSSEEEYEELCPPSGCVTINVIGKCQNNRYNGMITPQIKIESYEIVKRQEYYF